MSHSADDLPIVLLPGLGADARLFGRQEEAWGRVVVPPWIPPRTRETLPEYARRMGETLNVSRPFVLGGASLGGMVAHEMAAHVRPEALVLIGSCRDSRSLPRWGSPCRPLVGWLPPVGLRLAGCFAPAVMRVLGGMDGPKRRLVVDMFRQADPRFMRWALDAILRWRSSPAVEGVPCFQIHGLRDRMIPARRVQPDEWIRDGGHLISLTHPAAVNAFLGRVMSEIVG